MPFACMHASVSGAWALVMNRRTLLGEGIAAGARPGTGTQLCKVGQRDWPPQAPIEASLRSFPSKLVAGAGQVPILLPALNPIF